MVHLEMFTYCPKYPHYVLGHYLTYMIILNAHVEYGIRLDTWMPSTLCENIHNGFSFRLGSSLHVHLLNINFGLGYDNPKSIFLIRI